MAACYVRHNSDIFVTDNNTPCSTGPGFHQCCATANGDICGSDGFCHFTHQQSASVTGYYLGGCTDPEFAASVCPQHCTGYPTQDVVYNSTSGLWACCYGGNELNCGLPSNETFYAPSIDDLFPFKAPPASSSSVSSSAASTLLPSSTRSMSSTRHTKSATLHDTTTTPTPKSAGSSSTPTSTIVPAVVVPIVAILVAAAIGFWLFKKRRSAKTQPDRVQDAPASTHMRQNPPPVEFGENRKTEITDMRKPQELGGSSISELPTKRM